MPKRNSNGEGGVWQEPSGRWRGAISTTNALGKAIRIERYGKTRREVLDKLAIARNDLAHSEQRKQNPTIADHLAAWMEEIIIPHREATTAHRYEQTIRIDINPHLGTVRLAKLNERQCQAWVNLLKSTKGDHAAEEGVKRLRAALNQAIRWKLIVSNPLKDVQFSHSEAKPIAPLTPEQAVLLLEAAHGD